MPANTGAIFNEARTHRYSLWRMDDAAVHSFRDRRAVLFVGMNPSTANEDVDDATIRRCRNFARSWGFRGILMGNLYALRATDPKELFTISPEKAVGKENDKYLKRMSLSAGMVVACWGAIPHPLRGRELEVMEIVGPTRCLGFTKDGHPRHPLYVPATEETIQFGV